MDTDRVRLTNTLAECVLKYKLQFKKYFSWILKKNQLTFMKKNQLLTKFNVVSHKNEKFLNICSVWKTISKTLYLSETFTGLDQVFG